MKVLVTGAAGFIGSTLSLQLLARGDEVVGIDNHNDYYDPALKEARLARQINHANYAHIRLDLADRPGMAALFEEHKPQRVVNLAAEAPEQCIKPKRSLIVALSGVVGGMLAIMFVLIRNAVRNRKA